MCGREIQGRRINSYKAGEGKQQSRVHAITSTTTMSIHHVRPAYPPCPACPPWPHHDPGFCPPLQTSGGFSCAKLPGSALLTRPIAATAPYSVRFSLLFLCFLAARLSPISPPRYQALFLFLLLVSRPRHSIGIEVLPPLHPVSAYLDTRNLDRHLDHLCLCVLLSFTLASQHPPVSPSLHLCPGARHCLSVRAFSPITAILPPSTERKHY